ncbi:MAG: protein translocase subunit SecF, partial [Spirochaetales bacterium]|nr:protein translocase subunit SecF [Spirochaetales bacterium]
DLTVVAAILTIIGYSINDTIVIFDRVRENSKIMKDEHPDKIFNVSLSQTLGRTFITSITTLFPVIALFIFGGSNIKGFAFVIMIGIVAGTISTLFLASTIALAFERSLSKDKIKKIEAIQEREEKKAKELTNSENGDVATEASAAKGEDIAISKKTMMKLMGKKK